MRHIAELGIDVTTNPAEIADFLVKRRRRRPAVVIATYQSSNRVSKGQRRARKSFDLILCDEAHRLAGDVRGKFATVLDDHKIKGRHRLFMTATLRRAVTALAIGNIGKQREAPTGGHAAGGQPTGGCCDTQAKLRSHDTSRIAWAKLMARVGEEFPLQCPACGGDIRLIAFITEPGPIRKILAHLGEPLEPPPVSPARGPPTAWGELVQMHDDREAVQVSPDELPAIDIHSL